MLRLKQYNIDDRYMAMKFFEDCLVSDFKGLIKNTLVGSVIFLVMTMSLVYLFVRIFKIDTFISEVIIIVIIAAIMVYVYWDELHIMLLRRNLYLKIMR